MSKPDETNEIDAGSALPAGAPTTALGPVPVAAREAQTVEVPETYLLVVTVRDRIGSPLAGAEVTVTVDGHPQVPRTTDATGLVESLVFVAPRKNVEVSARFPPLPADAEPKPGALAMQAAERTLEAAEVARLARPLVAGEKPEWPEAQGRARGALHLSLRPVCRYSPLHLFPWQNQILRELVYRKVPDGPTDVGRARSGAKEDPNDTADRKQRLRDFIRLYGPKIRGAPSIAVFLQESRGELKPDPELEALYKKAADARELQRRLLRIDRRMDWLKYKHGHGHWGAYVLGDPGAPPPPPPEPAQEPPIAADDPTVADAPADAAAPSVDEAKPLPPPADDPGAGEADIDTTKPINEHRALRIRRTSLLKQAKTDKIDAGSVLAAEVLQLTHRELLAYIQRHIFEKDADGHIVPPWVRYAVIHFSGLRYAGAHFAYYPAEEILTSLRRAEIDAGATEPTADPQRLAILLEEHLAMIRDEPALEAGLLGPKERKARAAALEKNAPIARAAVVGSLQDALAALQGGATEAAPAPAGKKKAAPVSPEETLKSVVRACSDFWGRELNNADLRRAAFSPPAGGAQSSPPPPLEEAWGLLVHRRDTGKLPADAWPAVVQYTELRNDFVNVASVAFPKPKKAKKGEPPPAPDPIPPPVGNSRWPVLAPSVEGSPHREYPGALQLVGQKRMLAWKTQQADDLSLVTSRAVCNQITEMVAAARGVVLKGGIEGDSRAAHATVATDDNEDDDDNDTDASFQSRALLNMGRALRIAGGLYIPASPDTIKRGDLMYFLTWRQLGDAPDPSAWVSPHLPIPGFRLAVYNVNDALPVPPPPPPKKGEPKPPPPPAPGPQSVLWVTRSGGSSVGFVDSHGTPVTVLRADEESKLLRGSGARPATVALDGADNRDSTRHAGLDQIALAPTSLSAKTKLDYVFVRRHPAAKRYHEVLGWSHIATVIDPPDASGYLVTFETNAPTGVNRRPWRPGWSVVFGRPLGQSEGAPHLAHFLDKRSLLDEARLPKTEDR